MPDVMTDGGCGEEELELEGQCWQGHNLGPARRFALDGKTSTLVFAAEGQLGVATSEGDELSVETFELELDFLVQGVALGSFSDVARREALIFGHSEIALADVETGELIAVVPSTLPGGGGVAILAADGQDRVVGFSEELGTYGLRSARWDGAAWDTEWSQQTPAVACWINSAVRFPDEADGLTVASVTTSDDPTCESGAGSHVLLSWSANGVEVTGDVGTGLVVSTSPYRATNGDTLPVFWGDGSAEVLVDPGAGESENWSVSGFDVSGWPVAFGQLDGATANDEALVVTPSGGVIGRVSEADRSVEFEQWDTRLPGAARLLDLNSDGVSDVFGISNGEMVAWISK